MHPGMLWSQSHGDYKVIYSGVPWIDNQGNTVSAHGANIIMDKGKFYLFGEAHQGIQNDFAGFNCYSSTDLCNWKFESVALPVQEKDRLGPNRVGERPKVMRCPKTGEYVMLMHTDTLGYKDPCVGYATSKTITGPYTFQGPILFNNNPIHKWDMGTFQDTDGTGYLLVHSGNIYRLSEDYKSIESQVVKDMESEGESPAMIKKDGIYYFLASHRTSWERNDNFYYTSKSINGPWLAQGNFAPKGTLTWNSQTSFVLPIIGSKDTTFMFMGDRWSFPRQASSATYVWQPISFSDSTISIPNYEEAWQFNPITGESSKVKIQGELIKDTQIQKINYKGKWSHLLGSNNSSFTQSDSKGASFSLEFIGRQIGFYCLSDNEGGYASVLLTNSKHEIVMNSIVDLYCKYPVSSLKFMSPIFKKDNYNLTVTLMGERGNWIDKRKSEFGSKGNFVKLDKIIFKK